MKLHLPKALLTAVVAAGLAFSSAYAEGTAAVTKSSDLTYTGAIYTLGAKDTGNSLLAGSVYETTLVPAVDGEEASWKLSDTATSTGSNKWAALYAEGSVNGTNYASYNTLRVTLNDEYRYQFSALSMAGIIVEDGVDGASFVSSGTSNRNIYIGKTAVSSNSYFGGSFTFDNTSSNDNTNTIIKVDGTQGWYIAAGKTVTLKANEGVVNNATWTINGGTVEITNGLTTSSTIYSNDSTFKHSGGALTIGSAVGALEAVGAVEYSDGDDGYIKGDFYLVKGTGSASSVASTVTDVAGKNYTVQADGGNLIISADDTATGGYYYVNTEKNYGDENSVIMADTTTGIAMNGGKLNLNKALESNVTISSLQSGTGGTIKIADNITLNNSSLTAGAVKSTITGSKNTVYEMGSATTANATFGTDWYGTTKLDGTALVGSVNLASFANGANSTIEFKNTSGWITATTNAFNVSLAEGDAITFTNGGNNEHHVFTGNISGKGNIVRKDNKGSFQYYDLKGDISQWSGTFEHKNTNLSHESTITLSGAATNANANFTQSGSGDGKLSVVVDNTNDVTMNGTVSATAGTIKLQNKGTGKLTVAEVKAAGGNVQISGNGSNAIEIGTLSIAAGNTVANGTTASKGNAAPTSTNDASVDITITSKLAIASDNAFTLSGALTMGSNATVDLTGFTINEGQTIYTLGSAGSINFATGTDYLAGTGIEGYTAKVTIANTNPNASEATVADADAPQYLVLTLSAPQTQEMLTQFNITGGTYEGDVLTFTTDVEDATAVVFGEHLNALMSDKVWNEILEKYELGETVKVSFADANGGELLDFDGYGDLNVPTITINGEGTQGAQVLTGDGTVVGNYVTAYIPEPATSTLSLLALAALAVRRRRR